MLFKSLELPLLTEQESSAMRAFTARVLVLLVPDGTSFGKHRIHLFTVHLT
jgi:hypothetical protein